MTSQFSPVSKKEQEQLEQLSPFELRENLLSLAAGQPPLLNAGRGNPNFLASTPRQAFFQLGLFAVSDAAGCGSWSSELVGMPRPTGSAERLKHWLTTHSDQAGSAFLQAVLDWATAKGWNLDGFVYELEDAILGEHYPTPAAILPHVADIVREYLAKNMGEGFPANADLFATEGGTAAMCYVFETLRANYFLNEGDKVALLTPIFTPYIDIINLPEYGLEQVNINASGVFADGTHNWQFPQEELAKLRDPEIKAVVCINPTNPPSVKMSEATLKELSAIISKRTDLIVITDDVYGTFANDFRSIFSINPQNTILAYSFSKYFGATGWRLGVIATSPDTVLNDLLESLPAQKKATLAKRYSSLTDTPAKLTFAERLVADSRDVALNHTAGLSTPQQVQMALFALFDLFDTDNTYRKAAKDLISKRLSDLLSGLDITLDPDPNRVGYYIEIDFMSYVNQHYPPAFATYLEQTFTPSDILFRLAAQHGIVALDGAGFDGPPWSIRLSLANLDDSAYLTIGQAIRAVSEEYVNEWHNHTSTKDN